MGSDHLGKSSSQQQGMIKNHRVVNLADSFRKNYSETSSSQGKNCSHKKENYQNPNGVTCANLSKCSESQEVFLKCSYMWLLNIQYLLATSNSRQTYIFG
jgi:hypothetical protein